MVSEDGKECIDPKCPSRSKIPEFITTLQDCVKCEDYTITGADLKTCVPPTCNNMDIVLRDGQCKECSKH